jgi:Fe2+ transport system protein FeoA
LLRYLDELGLVPGAQIEIREYSPFDHNLTIKAGRKLFVLGPNITSKIFIEEL